MTPRKKFLRFKPYPVVGFGVTQANKSEGFISGSQGVVGNQGQVTTLSTQIIKSSSGSKINYLSVPPPGMVGNTAGIADEFGKELKSRLRN